MSYRTDRHGKVIPPSRFDALEIIFALFFFGVFVAGIVGLLSPIWLWGQPGYGIGAIAVIESLSLFGVVVGALCLLEAL